MSEALTSFSELLSRVPLEGAPSSAYSRIENYYKLVLQESITQNLTRHTDPLSFITQNLWDLKALRQSGELSEPSIDCGSGMGVPGLLYALIWGGTWVLVEAEVRKAEFLRKMIEHFNLGHVSVIHGRLEETLTEQIQNPGSIVVRAVADITKIWKWTRRCSTWNNIILLKGPKWDEEWREFSKTHPKNPLSVKKLLLYRLPGSDVDRKIVSLVRVPRGTIGQPGV